MRDLARVHLVVAEDRAEAGVDLGDRLTGVANVDPLVPVVRAKLDVSFLIRRRHRGQEEVHVPRFGALLVLALEIQRKEVRQVGCSGFVRHLPAVFADEQLELHAEEVAAGAEPAGVD